MGNKIFHNGCYDWSLLNRDCKDIVQGVLKKWQQLVASGETESHFQRFLSDHAGMFFGRDGISFAISQLQLGSERRPDFVVIHDGRSAGKDLVKSLKSNSLFDEFARRQQTKASIIS